MSRIRSKDTLPELRVRRAAHALGLRYRLHRKDLPGTPDLVFPRYRTAIFVHGCFWHRHFECRKASLPKSRLDYWQAKFDANIARDARSERDLRHMGWRVFTLWECQTTNLDVITSKLAEIFELRGE